MVSYPAGEAAHVAARRVPGPRPERGHRARRAQREPGRRRVLRRHRCPS